MRKNDLMPNLQKRLVWITFHFLFDDDIIEDIPSTSKTTYNLCIQELFLQNIIANVKNIKNKCFAASCRQWVRRVVRLFEILLPQLQAFRSFYTHSNQH